jgi:hypothetical protein
MGEFRNLILAILGSMLLVAAIDGYYLFKFIPDNL